MRQEKKWIMKYDWKTLSGSITVKPNRKNKKLLNYMCERLKQGEICLTHDIDYSLFENHYRRYRRGKNRCIHCGVKL